MTQASLPSAKKSTTNMVNLYTSCAYNNFETVTSFHQSSFPPPPKVVTTSTKYKLFMATDDLVDFKRYCFRRKGRANNMFCLKRIVKSIIKAITSCYRWFLVKPMFGKTKTLLFANQVSEQIQWTTSLLKIG